METLKTDPGAASLSFVCLCLKLPSLPDIRAGFVPALQRLSGGRLICSLTLLRAQTLAIAFRFLFKKEAGLSVEEERNTFTLLSSLPIPIQHTNTDCASQRRCPWHLRNDSAKRALSVNVNQAAAEEEKQLLWVLCYSSIKSEVSVLVANRTRTKQSDSEGGLQEPCEAAECNQR